MLTKAIEGIKETGNLRINVKLRYVPVIIFAVERQYVHITYSECVSAASVIQHAKCMSRIILSCVACLEQTYFSTLPHKRHDFRKKSLNKNVSVDFSLQLLSATYLFRRRIQRDIINVEKSSCKVPVFLARF
jgi:hypothetical protein